MYRGERVTGQIQRRRQRPRPLSSPVRYALLFATGVFVLNALVGESGLLAMLAANRHHDAVAARLKALHLENEELREEARRLREDPALIEVVARRDLGLMRPGERLFIVRDR